jgi:hypothetical protein
MIHVSILHAGLARGKMRLAGGSCLGAGRVFFFVNKKEAKKTLII